MTVDWEFFDRMTPDEAIAVLDALESGQEVRSTRGPAVRGFRAASRTISGIDDDGLTAEGGAADALMMATTTAAAERGIPAADGGPASGDGPIGKVTLT
jgi:NADH-quinone oxidoreductase subunit E